MVRSWLSKIFKAEFSLLWLLLITFLFFSLKIGDYFYSMENIMSMLSTASSMALMVLGVTWVIGADEMDASFPEVAACASMVLATMIHRGYGLGLTIVVTLIVGAVLGCITGFFVVKFNFHSLITTIAVATIAKSLAAALNGGMPLPIPVIKSSGFYHFINSRFLGIPTVFLLVLLIYILFYLIQEKTKFGQYIYALGENRQAVKEAGIKIKVVLTLIFVFSSLFATLGGLVMVFNVYGSGQPLMGSSFFLDGFTVVFLGAMILKLGKTNVVGTFVGALMLAMLLNGLTMLGSSFALGQIIKGLLLVLGILVVSQSQKRRKGKVGVLKYE